MLCTPYIQQNTRFTLALLVAARSVKKSFGVNITKRIKNSSGRFMIIVGRASIMRTRSGLRSVLP